MKLRAGLHTPEDAVLLHLLQVLHQVVIKMKDVHSCLRSAFIFLVMDIMGRHSQPKWMGHVGLPAALVILKGWTLRLVKCQGKVEGLLPEGWAPALEPGSPGALGPWSPGALEPAPWLFTLGERGPHRKGLGNEPTTWGDSVGSGFVTPSSLKGCRVRPVMGIQGRS